MFSSIDVPGVGLGSAVPQGGGSAVDEGQMGRMAPPRLHCIMVAGKHLPQQLVLDAMHLQDTTTAGPGTSIDHDIGHLSCYQLIKS